MEEKDIIAAAEGTETFENQDVLFLYSTILLNQSETMR